MSVAGLVASGLRDTRKISFRIVPVSRFLVAIAAVSIAVALGGCGRRGPLEAPPGSLASPPRTAAVIDPAPQPNSVARGSLIRDTSGQEGLSREQVGVQATPTNVPRTPFILDPLL